MNALVSGRKHWVVLQPDYAESAACQTPFAPPIGTPTGQNEEGGGGGGVAAGGRREHMSAWLRRAGASQEWQEAGGWQACMWQCTQEPGDVVYVPNLVKGAAARDTPRFKLKLSI